MTIPVTIKFLAFVFLVIQQAAGDFLYFSLDPAHMTQSQAPWLACEGAQNDNMMMLVESSPVVHSMQVGQRLTLSFRDGRSEAYVITQINKYIALDGPNPYGLFISEQTGWQMAAREIFYFEYCNPLWKLNIQTCYDGFNRMMVHAVPLEMWERWEMMQ